MNASHAASRRRFLAALPAAMLPGLPHAAEAFPSRPVKIVVPFTPGGSNDVLARVLAERLGPTWGQPVVVENRPGAAGNIGADAVAKSPADGYTLLIAANNILTMNPSVFARMPFDAQRDLQSVALLGTVPVLLVAGPSAPVSTVAELIALAKSRKGGITFASSGAGSPQHLSAELFRSMANVPMTHIPYKGAGPAITDLLGGQVDVTFGAINQLLPHVKAGKLRPLGVAGKARADVLSQVPTIAEAGVPGYESDIWIGLSMPARPAPAVLRKLNQDVAHVLALPDVKKQLAEQGIEAMSSTPEAMTALVSTDLARWARVIRQAGIEQQQ